jgi:hypothetical protein
MTPAPIRCPTCGHLLGRDPRPVIEALRDNTIRFAMLEALASRFGEWIRIPALELMLYGHRGDGGPLTSRKTLSVYANVLRPRLRPYGLTIEGMRSGEHSGAYRLRWIVPVHDGRDWLTVDRQAASP